MNLDKRIGVLGGGQLGKMIAQAASRWDLDIHLLDASIDFPAAKATPLFSEGNFRDYDDVISFGADKDILTIEIENVNTKALVELEKQGKKIYPQPSVIETIKDKGLQKNFYRDHNLPTSSYLLVDDAAAILNLISQSKLKVPFVQKARTEGYDGRGDHVVRSDRDLENLLDVPSVIEDLVAIDKEIAVIAARSVGGEISVFPAVEMSFHPTANLVEELLSPARVSPELENAAQSLARQIISAFDMVGLLAIEFFLDQNGDLLINEAAPRPHNSGHQTIEGNITSQYEQLLRAILNLPLGSTQLRSPSVMINLLGAPNHQGNASYQGLTEAMALENVHIHLYGKKETKPFRKMGHVTVLDKVLDKALQRAKEVQKLITIVAD